MENESAQEKAARRRARRMQHLIPDEALRRSPRIRRSGAPPFYGPAPRRTSREASLATDDDASSVASSGSRRSRSSRRSSRASEMLNESGQVLYEGSESEADQDVTVVSSTRYAAAYVRHRVAYQAQQVDQALGQLVRSPRSLNSGDSGVASGNEWVARSAAGEAAQQRRSEDHLVEGGVEEDLPPHVFGLDSDGGDRRGRVGGSRVGLMPCVSGDVGPSAPMHRSGRHPGRTVQVQEGTHSFAAATFTRCPSSSSSVHKESGQLPLPLSSVCADL